MQRMDASFNEAAGIPRGRQARFARVILDGAQASMRPRVFPAEDLRAGACPDRCDPRASMRPRVFPAEDGEGGRNLARVVFKLQ